MTMKVMTIISTGLEIIKLSRVMHEIDKHIEHVLVHTGQNYDYELNEIFFKSWVSASRIIFSMRSARRCADYR